MCELRKELGLLSAVYGPVITEGVGGFCGGLTSPRRPGPAAAAATGLTRRLEQSGPRVPMDPAGAATAAIHCDFSLSRASPDFIRL